MNSYSPVARRPQALIAWSSGKDSAWALHVLQTEGRFEIVGALTTITEGVDRVSMHGVREELLRAQLNSAGLSPVIVRIPSPCPNEIYEARMEATMRAASADGVTHVAFGDLFLEDIRAYREAQLAKVEMTPLFPLWHTPTADLAREMIGAGLRAQVVCIDGRKLSARFAGREFDSSFLDELPAGVDPCGENGEFHTFVSAGPMLKRRVDVIVGGTIDRDGFVFADLCPAD